MSLNITSYPHRIHEVSGNPCFWNSSRQPFVFNIQRQDGVFFGVNDAGGFAQLVVASYIASASEVVVGSKIYFKDLNGYYDGTATVTAIPVTGVPYYAFTTDIPYTSFSIGGYFNLNSRINYGIVATITVEQNGFTTIKTCKVAPDSKGDGMVDISPYINGAMSKVDNRPDVLDWVDKNTFCKVNVSFIESWRNSSESPLIVPYTYYGIDGVKAIGDKYGQNFADFVPQTDVPPSKGKFLTGFEQPIYFEGYPFDLAYIHPQEYNGAYCWMLRVFNDSGKNILGSDGATLDNAIGIGVHRVNFDVGDPNPNTSTIDVSVFTGGTWGSLYVDLGYVEDDYVEGTNGTEDTTYEIIEPINVSLDRICGNYKLPVYIKWRNHLGGWDYFLFQNRQEIETTAKQLADFTTEPFELSTAIGRESITVSQQTTRVTMGSIIGQKQISGIKGIERSPCVMMLTDKDNNKWVRVRIVPKGFKMDTRAKSIPVEITIELPDTYSVAN